MGTTLTAEMPIIEARKNLTALPERLEEEPGAIAVTRRGKPVLAILPWDLYESIVETLEILGDEDQVCSFRKGMKEVLQGKAIPWEKAKRRL